MKWDCDLTILGETASKANSRRIVRIKGVTRVIRSAKALHYADRFKEQCPVLCPLLDHDKVRLLVVMDIYYGSRRPDLDESLILDLLQDKAYRNDRSVRAKIVRWHLDKKNPRSRIRILRLSETYGEAF